MSTVIIDGRALAERIKQHTRGEVDALRREGISVQLHAVVVAEPDAGRSYAGSQEAVSTRPDHLRA